MRYDAALAAGFLCRPMGGAAAEPSSAAHAFAGLWPPRAGVSALIADEASRTTCSSTTRYSM